MVKNTFSENHHIIKTFVEKNKIGNYNYSGDHLFKAKVTYNNESLVFTSIICKVTIITESNDVKVNIYHDQNPTIYTSGFTVKYQNFTFTPQGNLLIEGKHSMNLQVGLYSVEISFIEDTNSIL